ncbi:MAG: cofactor-independent phosphoglycerate mutase [Pirellulaceae bacterium]|jgi:2,3-bisphosphoglycerate-independent phosphoglycerate mutase|nr:cofactor-independent phosphoglycerate mutase [Pirellulaceae bacterium]MDP7018120.1 cofactor-independent phosphoglycerate mutase [Pirellulaceae bacterium]
MKYAIVIPDGCADEPQDSLDGRTPLQAARTPHMDRVAAEGQVGRANNVPPHLPAGSAVANMSLLGYDPDEHFTGRAPLEAAAQGIELGPDDWAVRCNLVTIEDQTMRDFTADHISTAEAEQLLAAAQEELVDEHWEFVAGVSYRNLLIYRGSDAPFSRDTTATPPHDLTDKSVANDFPRGPGSDVLSDLMSRSVELFAKHDVNKSRLANGRLAATNVWLWGLGRSPSVTPFATAYGKSGKMITAVDLLRGIAALIGWDRVEAPGATGYTDTDYASKGRTAVETLPAADVVCVHVEAPDEASHEGDVAAKIKALEEIDRHIVGPLRDALASYGEYRILVSPDHPTPVRTKTHSHGIVPFALCGAGVAADQFDTYDEVTAAASALAFDQGWRLMKHLIG